MGGARRIELTEGEAMEGGVRCPKCGSYTSFGDIVAAGGCGGGQWRGGECDATLSLDLVVENPDPTSPYRSGESLSGTPRSRPTPVTDGDADRYLPADVEAPDPQSPVARRGEQE